MLTRLDTILQATRVTVAETKSRVPLAELERRAVSHDPRGWAASLRRKAVSEPAIIAEIKKASPSQGLIRKNFDVKWLATRYAEAGAAALSILTDEPFFQGSLHHLETASGAVILPCLRKDFLIDEYQIVEAKAHCADAILLIVAALKDEDLKRFSRLARGCALDVLVEIHSEDELDRALDVLGDTGADAIGVNNRDLRTFEVKMETSLNLVDRIPQSLVRVAESGITTSEQIGRLRVAGFDAFLIGESLMRQRDPGAALTALVGPIRVAR